MVLVVNMAAKHRFPGSRVCKIGRCRICTHYLEADKLEFGADVAARVDYCARHYDDFRQLVGDSDSDKVNILSVPISKSVAEPALYKLQLSVRKTVPITISNRHRVCHTVSANGSIS